MNAPHPASSVKERRFAMRATTSPWVERSSCKLPGSKRNEDPKEVTKEVSLNLHTKPAPLVRAECTDCTQWTACVHVRRRARVHKHGSLQLMSKRLKGSYYSSVSDVSAVPIKNPNCIPQVAGIHT